MPAETTDDVGSLGSVLRDLVATPADRQIAPLVPGAVVGGHYVIERALGVGGMGVVYLARDTKLGRNVAVKLGHILSRDALVRIEREAIALAQVSHPNVVVVHEVGDVDGRLFIAMEYVDGGNAREWAAATRPWREVVRLYAAAGDGLAAAHAAGFVHRDFKPDNVLVGVDGRPRVADFGLVRSGVSQGDETTEPGTARRRNALATATPPPAAWAAALASSTRTGTVLGTPAYMAPEQVAGATVGPAADQFSFCASAWEALYGARYPAQPRRLAPRRLERILRRGLAADPDARWPSMHELIAALRATTRGARVAALAIAAGAIVAVASGAAVTRAAASPAAAAVACDPIVHDAREVFVDAAAPAGGNGRAGCPLRTITAALALPPVAHRTIHVAAGTYDRALGERFPLIVRGDAAIVGAGEDATHVVGDGKYDHAEGGLVDGTMRATFLVGDARGDVSLASMSIAAERATQEFSVYGVMCDRGNLSSLTGPIAPENTHLASLTIGPGYDAAVVVGTSLRPRGIGCNLAITGSTITSSSIGMWVGGCGGGDNSQLPARATVGDGTDRGRNLFTSIRTPEHDGVALRVWDCTRSLRVLDNIFAGGDSGVSVTRHADELVDPEIELVGNSFRSYTRFGVKLARGVTVARLDDNLFLDITAQPAPRSAAERASALLLDGENERVPGFPQVAHARRNTFTNDDVAIEIRGGAMRPGPRAIVDFGRPDDPGHNAFRCSGTAAGSSVPGYDVLVSAPSDGTGALWLAGDEWDHAPPAIVRTMVGTMGATSDGTTGGDAPNGADVVLPAGLAPALDVSGATTPELGCGSRAAGPAH